MIVKFAPKFYLGEIRLIYLERLYKKALRVGASTELIREADTLLNFALWERGLAGHDFDTSLGEKLQTKSDYPAELSCPSLPLIERAFVAECINASNGADLMWQLYFDSAEETINQLQEELELFE